MAALQIDKTACTKCVADRPHPWHDNGEPNQDDRYDPGGPLAPPTHSMEEQ